MSERISVEFVIHNSNNETLSVGEDFNQCSDIRIVRSNAHGLPVDSIALTKSEAKVLSQALIQYLNVSKKV